MNHRGPNYLPIVNRGAFVVGGTLHNSGTIRNDYGGVFTVLQSAEVVGAGSHSQAQSSTHVDDVLNARSLLFVNGRLTGSGSLVGTVTSRSAIVAPGNSPGILTIDGRLTASGSLFEIERASPALADQVHVTGAASFNNGRVLSNLTGSYRPQIGDHFQWLQADGGISVQGTMDWLFFTSPPGARDEVFWQPPHGMQVAFHGGQLGFTAAPVPEPATWLLMRDRTAVGLVGLQPGLLGQDARDGAVNDLQHRCHQVRLCRQQQAQRNRQPKWQTPHPLAYRHWRDDAVDRVGHGLRHAPQQPDRPVAGA